MKMRDLFANDSHLQMIWVYTIFYHCDLKMTYKIQILNNIAQIGLDHFTNYYSVHEKMAAPDAILLRSFKLTDAAISDSVKVIARAGVGVNNIPIDYCSKVGIPVLNTPGANANAVKELVLTGMLMSCRHITRAWDYTKQLCGDDQTVNRVVEQDKKQFAGRELAGKTLAVIGLGNIGLRVANTAVDLDMRVIGFDAAITVKHAWQLSSQVQQAHSLEDAIRTADFVSLHIPLFEKTLGLINADILKKMRPHSVLLNFARAEIVDKDALLSALESHLNYYVCDFPSADFIHNPKVICLPHLGASTQEAEENCAVMAVDQLKLFLEHGEIINSVNFPDVKMPRTEGHRISIVNANVPNMLAQISQTFSSKNINIIDMINKSRGEIAYTLLDLAQPITDDVVTHLEKIKGIIRVRKI